MNTPQYILDLLEVELQHCMRSVLEKVATKYNLDIQSLCEEFLQPVHIVKDTDEEIRIRRTQRTKPIPPADERCLARIWNRGRGGQCTRWRKGEYCYCIYHEKHRKYGDMTHPPDLTQFPKKHTSLYK